MKIAKILAILLLLPVLASAQNVRKNMADKYYGYLYFSKAAPIYDELAKSAVKKSKKGKAVDWDMVRRAAQSNFYIRNYNKSAQWYGELTTGPTATKDDYMMYFEALRYIGDYNKASVFLDSLYKMDPSDFKVKEYIRQSNYFNYLKRDSANYKIQTLPFNKDLGDFGPAFYDKGLVYASSHKKGTLERNYEWDNTLFLNAYYVEGTGVNISKHTKLLRKSFKSLPHDGPVFFSKDNNTAYFTRNRKGRDKNRGEFIVLNLYIVQKGADNKWGELQPFQYNSAEYSIGHAALSPDEKTLYFASDMPGGQGGVDIWKCEKQGGGWSIPVNLGKDVNTPDDDMFPFITAEGNLWYASKGFVGLGGLDLFEARKAQDGFMSPVNMGYPINTHFDDFALISQNGTLGYFSSDRDDYIDRILAVDMPRRKIFNLEGKVFNELARTEVIPQADIVVRNLTLGDSIIVAANDSGKFFVPLLSESDYEITAQKSKYDPTQPVRLTTKGLTDSKNFFEKLYLIPKIDPTLLANDYIIDSLGNKVEIVRPRNEGEGLLVVKVVDCFSREPIVGLKLSIEDLETGVTSRVKTNQNGELLIRQSTFELPVSREFAVINEAFEMASNGKAYEPTVKKTFFILKGTEPNLTAYKSICMTPLSDSSTFVLNDIYYDLDKATLRPASITQLDRAYEFLMRNRNVKVELSSHTDSRASDNYNMNLSQRRAQSCVDYLVKVKGLPANRIVAKGYGETKLTNGCADGTPCTEEQHQMNRRTEIRILEN